MYREVMEIQGRVMGEDHFNTLLTRGNLGELLNNAGRYADAEPLLSSAARDLEASLTEHPATGVTYEKYGSCLLGLKRMEQ